MSHLPTINLTAGCSIGCIYCYTLGYSSNPGKGKILLYTDTLEKLKSELSHKRTKPKAVFFSPSSDLFQPVPEVLTLNHHVLEFLLSKGIGVAFLTKGHITDNTMGLLLSHAERVRAQIGITTLDEYIARIFEPNAAGPIVRLEQMATLAAGGVKTEARLDPMLPGGTDDLDTLEGLFSGLAKAGVTQVAAGTLFLRPSIVKSLKQNTGDGKVLRRLLNQYEDSRSLTIRAEHSSVVNLSYE